MSTDSEHVEPNVTIGYGPLNVDERQGTEAMLTEAMLTHEDSAQTAPTTESSLITTLTSFSTDSVADDDQDDDSLSMGMPFTVGPQVAEAVGIHGDVSCSPSCPTLLDNLSADEGDERNNSMSNGLPSGGETKFSFPIQGDAASTSNQETNCPSHTDTDGDTGTTKQSDCLGPKPAFCGRVNKSQHVEEEMVRKSQPRAP